MRRVVRGEAARRARGPGRLRADVERDGLGEDAAERGRAEASRSRSVRTSTGRACSVGVDLRAGSLRDRSSVVPMRHPSADPFPCACSSPLAWSSWRGLGAAASRRRRRPRGLWPRVRRRRGRQRGRSRLRRRQESREHHPGRDRGRALPRAHDGRGATRRAGANDRRATPHGRGPGGLPATAPALPPPRPPHPPVRPPSGGMYIWYDSVRDDVAAPLVTQEADRIAAAVAALVAARPTVGKPLVTGFSQGGIMTFALAVTHPEALAAPSPSAACSRRRSTRRRRSARARARRHSAGCGLPRRLRPGGADPRARASIAELRRAGYTAELREYAGVEHDTSDEEEGDILERIGRAADGLEAAAPAP